MVSFIGAEHCQMEPVCYSFGMQYSFEKAGNYIAYSFGGKRAFVAAIIHLIRLYAGALRRYAQIDWRRVSRITFVCKGNICRSVFAEYRFRPSGVNTRSAGLDADPGKPANERACNVAIRRGVDLTPHRSTHVSQLDLNESDLVVAFEPAQADALRKLLAHQSRCQITLLGLWAPAAPMPYLHDPYGLPEAYFDACFGRIDRGLNGILAHWRSARQTQGDL